MTAQDKLIKFKLKNEFTLRQMANALGCDVSTLCRWMTGKQPISEKAKRNIKFTFGI